VEPPKILAIGGEEERGTKVNSGVMFINTTAMGHHHYGLLAWGIEHKFPDLFDQTMIQEYFREEDLDQLPDKFNWKVGRSAPSNGPSTPLRSCNAPARAGLASRGAESRAHYSWWLTCDAWARAMQGYWGSTDDAVIAHWHGPKPMRGLECLVAAQARGMNIDTACPQVHSIYRSVVSATTGRDHVPSAVAMLSLELVPPEGGFTITTQTWAGSTRR
jgi:hypothetical protein